MLNDFIAAGLWSTHDYYADENDESYGDCLDAKYSIEDVSDEFKVEAQALIDSFMREAESLFTSEELDYAHIGHDLWLTIEGHGCGFWDGDYEHGEELTALCKKLMPYSSTWSEKLNDSIKRD